MTEVCSPPVSKKSLPSRGIKSSSDIWTREKAVLDSELWGNREGLWLIENKVYDLMEFVGKHPGGSQWIELTRGQDLTEHFITHHLDEEKARSVLQKYYVRDVDAPLPLRFTFEEDGLYRRVKRRVLKEYRPDEIQDWSKSVNNGVVLIALFITLFVLSGLFHSYLLAILCGLSMCPLLGIAHNFIHMRWHPFRYLWMVTGFTHQEWQRMHCLSHHSYPNTLLDYEIQALEPIIYYLRVLPKNTILKGIVKEIFFPITTLINILMKIVIVPLQHRKQPEWFYLVPLMQLPLLALLADWESAWRLFLVMHVSCSFTFFKLTFLGHRTGREWTEGNQEIHDFAHHQIEASTDTQSNDACGLFSYIAYLGFNFHAVHHIFPTADNHILPRLDKILSEEASKMGIRRNILPSALAGIYEVEANFYSRKLWRARQ